MFEGERQRETERERESEMKASSRLSKPGCKDECTVHSAKDNFDNLPYASLTKACTALLPIPLIFALAPTFTPNDPVPEDLCQDIACLIPRE